ncbi:hypothetical protein [Lactobacillus bombicola]|uniref:BppU N-terminal domain-containing protein n=1 Tax=Lactobacillus bombicola TaxID=1505723 RepID=A0A396T3A1_9LACO|nr:hypothetical protein [Lactobacillus bombicola]RHW53723.1 hypothetical protein DS835_07225 [Lactobacillus bombicola]
MSEYNKTILTNQGLDLMARANKGTARFAITRAATSTEQLTNKSMADLQQLTELPSLMQYGVINNVDDSYQDSNVVIGVELVFNNQDLANGYNINTIGLFAKEDGQDKEILYAITTAVIPESMPDYKNKVLFNFSLTMFVAVGRTDNVSVIVDDSNSATKADLTKVKKELDGKANVGDVYSKTKIDEKLNQAGKLKKISVNGDTPVEPDDKGVANILVPQPDLSGLVKKINSHLPDQSGEVDLTDQFAQKKDLGNLYGMTTSGVKQSFSKVTVTPDTITDTGVYRLSACNITAQVDGKPLTPRQWGWLIVLNYNDAADTNGLYQFLVINEKISKRVISLQQQTYPDFKTIADSDDLKLLTESIASKAGAVNGVKPDSTGNISLPSLDNPNYTITTSPFDLDLAINLGIYRLNGVDLTTSKRVDALTALPSTAIKGAKGFLIQKHYNDYYNMQILVLYDMPNDTDITWAFRCIGIGSSEYRDTFKRITTDIDYTTLLNQVNQKANTNDVYTKFQTDNRLSLKANTSDIYTRSQIDNKLASISVGGDIDAINRKLGDKANVSDVYSKSQSDSKFGGAIKKIDGYSPDSSGNMNLGNTYATINSVNKKANTSDIYTQSQIDQKLYFKANTYDVYNRDEIDDKLNKKLSGFSNPDYVFGSSSTIDVDGVVSGVFALNGCSLKASKGGSYVFTNVDLTEHNWGYLVVSNYSGFTGGYHVGACVEYLVLLGTFNDVIGVYIRSFSPNDSYYNNVFKKLTN